MKEAKQRLIYLYLPSLEKRDELKILAKKAKMPLSKFIVEHVENSLRQEQDKEEFTSRLDLMNDLKKIKEENKDLHKKIKMLENLVVRLEKDIRSQTIEPHLDKEFIGDVRYEEDLVRLFKTCPEVRKEDLYKKLCVDITDTDAITAIQNQIDALERFGFLKDIGGKWRWKE